LVTIGSGLFGWLRVKVCIFPYTLKVVLTTLTLLCECDFPKINSVLHCTVISIGIAYWYQQNPIILSIQQLSDIVLTLFEK